MFVNVAIVKVPKFYPWDRIAFTVRSETAPEHRSIFVQLLVNTKIERCFRTQPYAQPLYVF